MEKCTVCGNEIPEERRIGEIHADIPVPVESITCSQTCEDVVWKREKEARSSSENQ